LQVLAIYSAGLKKFPKILALIIPIDERMNLLPGFILPNLSYF